MPTLPSYGIRSSLLGRPDGAFHFTMTTVGDPRWSGSVIRIMADAGVKVVGKTQRPGETDYFTRISVPGGSAR